MRNLKQLACAVALVSSSMAYSEVVPVSIEGSGSLYAINVATRGAPTGTAVMSPRETTLADAAMGLFTNDDVNSIFDVLLIDSFAQVLNNGKKAYDGGLAADRARSNRPYPLVGSYPTFEGATFFPAFKDIPHSGFNTTTKAFEIKFTLRQITTAPKEGFNTMDLPAVFFYEPEKGTGYIQSLQCNNLFKSGTQRPDNSGQNYSSTCGFVNLGGVQNFVKDLPPYKEPRTNVDHADYWVFGNGAIKFDAADPKKFNVILGNFDNAQLDLNFEMRSVPVPAAVWLFGSAVLGLLGSKRLKKNK